MLTPEIKSFITFVEHLACHCYVGAAWLGLPAGGKNDRGIETIKQSFCWLDRMTAAEAVSQVTIEILNL